MKHLSLILAISAALAADSGYNLFQKGLARERADADPRSAIKIYEQVVRENAKDRKLAAQALVRIAECYAKLGDIQSRQVYERIVRDFSDQSDAVTTARARLASAPAAAATGITTRQLWSGRGVDGGGSVSSDGRLLSFIDWSTGDLAIRDLTTNTNQILTNTGGWSTSGGTQAIRSVISPDGKLIAYAWYVGETERTEIRILPVGAPRNATPKIIPLRYKGYASIEPFSWSPDGKQLLVCIRREDRARQIAMLTIADASLNSLKLLGDVFPSPRLSPDGRFVAYDAPSPGEQQTDIFVMAADGSGETVIAPNSSPDSQPLWSPDGKTLLFASFRTGTSGLVSVRMENGKQAGAPQLVRADLGGSNLIGVTRTGSLVYHVSGHRVRDVYVVNLNTPSPALATDRNINSNFGPAWSPDGSQLAYLTISKANAHSLIIRTLATGTERTVPVTIPIGNRFSSGPRWFPDGKSVLLIGARAEGKGIPFFRVDLATGKAETVHHVSNNSLSSYDLSTDGKSLFYCLQVELGKDGYSSGQILRYDFGAPAPVVLRKEGWFITLAPSPDGRQLAFQQSHRPGSATSISVMPVTGGEARELYRNAEWAGGSRYNSLTWAADQQSILFTREGATESAPQILWRLSAAGGTPVRTGIQLSSRMKNLAVHPDGQRLAYSTQDSDAGEIWAIDNFLK